MSVFTDHPYLSKAGECLLEAVDVFERAVGGHFDMGSFLRKRASPGARGTMGVREQRRISPSQILCRTACSPSSEAAPQCHIRPRTDPLMSLFSAIEIHVFITAPKTASILLVS